MGCRQARLALATTHNIDEVVVVYSYMGDMVVDRIGRCLEGTGVKVSFVKQEEPLGTAHAVRMAMEATGYDDSLIVYSDVYLPSTAADDISRMKLPSILVGLTDRPQEYGVVKVGEDGVVEGLVEKPKDYEGEADVFVGVAALAKEHLEMLKNIKPSPRGEYELTDLLAVLADGGELRAVRLSDPYSWRDIGRPWDLLLANRMALEEVEPRVEGDVHPSAVVEGKVVIEEGAKIRPNAVIEGPAYIGREAVVGPCARVRPGTVLLNRSYVGFGVEVKGSVLFEEARAPHLNYVGDSLVGEHVNLGAGTITANLRFDKRTIKMVVKGVRVDTGLRKLGAVIGGYAQTGINVSLMPGVKVGSYALIYPHCVVDRDVPRGAVYKCR